MAATLSDVAARAGVSIKTVSNVIHSYPHIRPETKQRVLDAISQLDYRPNLNARNLRSGRTGVIGLVVPSLRNPYFSELAAAVIDAADHTGISVLIEQSTNAVQSTNAAQSTNTAQSTNAAQSGQSEPGRATKTQLVDGVLYSVRTPGHDDTGLYAQVTSAATGHRDESAPIDHVTMRNTEAIKAATEHLLALGRTRIAVVGARPGAEAGAASLRMLGYQQALASAGIEIDPSLVRQADRWTRFDGALATQALIDDGVAFDGIVGFNDSLALGALRVLGENGIRIPDEVSVIGFDDLDESRYSLPALTTISPGREQIAALAVEMLMERLSARDSVIEPREISVPFTLVERESTARVSS